MEILDEMNISFEMTYHQIRSIHVQAKQIEFCTFLGFVTSGSFKIETLVSVFM